MEILHSLPGGSDDRRVTLHLAVKVLRDLVLISLDAPSLILLRVGPRRSLLSSLLDQNLLLQVLQLMLGIELVDVTMALLALKFLRALQDLLLELTVFVLILLHNVLVEVVLSELFTVIELGALILVIFVFNPVQGLNRNFCGRTERWDLPLSKLLHRKVNSGLSEELTWIDVERFELYRAVLTQTRAILLLGVVPVGEF